MCSESLPKEFERVTEVLPLPTIGLSTIEQFRRAECDNQHLELLKRIGLSDEELKLYHQNETGCFNLKRKIEAGVFKNKLDVIYKKISDFQCGLGCSKTEVSSKLEVSDALVNKDQVKTMFYPKGHPMNDLKQLEEDMFGHLNTDTLPITKRRKILRRLQRKKKRILSEDIHTSNIVRVPAMNRPGSLWDVTDINHRLEKDCSPSKPIQKNKTNCTIGPLKPTMYTIKDNRIVRLEPTHRSCDEYRTVNIVMPVNAAEQQLLEGTKMSLDNIRKINRFKDYEPGIPSKVLYLKNIAPSVNQEQLELLFNQFILDNGKPIDVRLMTGRMRGQAFVTFQNEHLAMQALDEINGTILSGRPIIVQFGKNNVSN